MQVGTTPVTPVQTGQADILLTQTDVLRNNPQLLTKLYINNDSYVPFSDKLGMLNMKRAVQGAYTEHYEQPRERRSFTVGSIVTPSTGAATPITIALSPGDMQAITDDTGIVRYYSRPRVTETVQFADKVNYQIIAKDTTTNPAVHRLQIKAVTKTVDPAVAIVANAKAIIIGPAKAEATGQVKALTNLYIRYRNRFSIVDETSLTSGTAMTTKSPLAALAGQPGYWYLKDQAEATIRHEKNKGLRMILGQLGDGNVTQYSPDFDMNMPFQDTEGLIQNVLTSGKTITFDKTVPYGTDQLYAVTSYFRQQQVATPDLIAWQGYAISQAIETAFKSFLSNTYVDYVSKTFMKDALTSFESANLNSNDMFLSLGFYGIRVNKYNVLFASMDELNDIEGMGAFDYPWWQFVMPFALTKDAKSKKALPYMGSEYRGQDNGGYSRENEIWVTGGAGPIRKTDEFDVNRSYLRSEVCLHIANSNLIVLNRPQ